MTNTSEKIRKIRDKIHAYAPYPAEGDVSALALARHMAVIGLKRAAWLDCTPLRDSDRGRRVTEIDAMCADLAAAAALYALADKGMPELELGVGAPLIPDAVRGKPPAVVATMIRDIWESGELGEWLWEFLGKDVAEDVTSLVAQLAKLVPDKPRVVCLCGSTRFGAAFASANLEKTLAGEIVLSIGCDTKSDDDLAAANAPGASPEAVKARLDELHLRKIDMADYVYVLNVGGYTGRSTRREIAYAREQRKEVRFLEPENAPAEGEIA